jgi:methionyl-tRNA formyltransferase
MIASKPFVFFGSAPFSLLCLEELRTTGVVPELIITLEDAPQGRGQVLSPNIIKTYALEQGIKVLTPASLKNNSDLQLILSTPEYKDAIYLVSAYGKIIPEWLLTHSPYGILNIHPSLLPKYRGPSPIQSQIVDSAQSHVSLGTSIMLMDSEIDHGPILGQRSIQLSAWPLPNAEAETIFAQESVRLLQSILPEYLETKKVSEQDHGLATFTRKFNKQDAEIKSSDLPEKSYATYCAFHRDPGAFMMDHYNSKTIRLKINTATIVHEVFTPHTVTPEGKKIMSWQDYLRGKKT